jgi:hypothetical protein
MVFSFMFCLFLLSFLAARMVAMRSGKGDTAEEEAWQVSDARAGLREKRRDIGGGAGFEGRRVRSVLAFGIDAGRRWGGHEVRLWLGREWVWFVSLWWRGDKGEHGLLRFPVLAIGASSTGSASRARVLVLEFMVFVWDEGRDGLGW